MGGRLGIVYLQPNCNRAMFIHFANSGDTLHGGRRTGRLGKSRAFAPPLFTHPLLAPIYSFVISISGTRVGQCSAIRSPDTGFERKSP